MQIVGLEPRRSDLARGIVIARSAKPLTAEGQRALWQSLATAGVTEPGEDDDDEPERQWLAAPWLPPSAGEIDAQRDALDRAGTAFGLEAVWFVKVETGIDGIAWLEIVADQPLVPEVEPPPAAEEVDAIFEQQEQEVLYSAPDAPAVAAETEVEDEATEDDDELEQDVEIIESHWRNGVPPLENSVPFPIERYPEILEDYDWESLGIALKLAGDSRPGEESVVNAFFALWLSVYQDERADDFEPFQRADVIHDRCGSSRGCTRSCRSRGLGSIPSTMRSRRARSPRTKSRSSSRAIHSKSDFAVTAKKRRCHGRSRRVRGAVASSPGCSWRSLSSMTPMIRRPRSLPSACSAAHSPSIRARTRAATSPS